MILELFPKILKVFWIYIRSMQQAEIGYLSSYLPIAEEIRVYRGEIACPATV